MKGGNIRSLKNHGLLVSLEILVQTPIEKQLDPSIGSRGMFIPSSVKYVHD